MSKDDLLRYPFINQLVNKFSYDCNNKEIEIVFDLYYDFVSEQVIDEKDTLIIKNWDDAKSRVTKEKIIGELDDNMGIFSLILSYEVSQQNIIIAVNTLDNRYIEFTFVNPTIIYNGAEII